MGRERKQKVGYVKHMPDKKIDRIIAIRKMGFICRHCGAMEWE